MAIAIWINLRKDRQKLFLIGEENRRMTVFATFASFVLHYDHVQFRRWAKLILTDQISFILSLKADRVIPWEGQTKDES